MCAIGRLLDDAATCFANWSGFISATGVYSLLATASSRLQMYGNNAPAVADAETHACCCSFSKSSGFLPQPNCLSLYLRFVALSRSYLRVRGQCARAPLM